MMRPLVSCLMAVSLLGVVPSARAQEIAATSFEQLKLLIRPGDSISVTDRTGTTSTGTVRGLSDSTLEVDLGGQPRAFVEPDVRTIRQRRGDSLTNGALWGLAVGAGLAAVSASLVGVDCYGTANCVGNVAGAIGTGAAMGAGIGVGIDALIKGRKVIYQSPTGANRLNVVPLLTSHGKGVLLSLNF